MPSNWRRRLVTCPLTLLGLFVWTVICPVLYLGAAIVDIRRLRLRPTVRFVAFIQAWFICEGFGIVMLSLAGAFHLPGYANRIYRVQSWWMSLMLGFFFWIYDNQSTVEGLEHVTPGPVHVFCRHATLIDVVMVGKILANPFGLHLRYIFKKELLFDPAIDIFGRHVPNLFVDRHSADSAAEAEAIGRLGQNCGPLEGVVLYPEGTLFTQERLDKILRRMKERGDPLLEMSSKLRHVLPPRPGGALALLDTNTDILFFAHAGLGGVPYFSDYIKGKPVGRKIRIRIWRVAAADIPEGRDARLKWLYEQWTEMDRWIGVTEALDRPAQ